LLQSFRFISRRQLELQRFWKIFQKRRILERSTGRRRYTEKTKDIPVLENFPKSVYLLAQYNDEKWKPPLYDIWLACYTDDEIAELLSEPRKTINDKTKDMANLENFPISPKLLSQYQDVDWQPQLYDIWNFAKNTNNTKHW